MSFVKHDPELLAINKAQKNVQISLDVPVEKLNDLQIKAIKDGDQGNIQNFLRGKLGLDKKQPKRPRVGISLSPKDIILVARENGLEMGDLEAIKNLIKDLIDEETGG